MSSDSIADMLVMIKNSSSAKHSYVDIPFSKMKLEMIKVFKSEGFIKTFKFILKDNFNYIRVLLKYTKDNAPVIDGIKRVSRCGCRVYSSCRDIPRVYNGFGTVIMSTSRGVVTGKKAKKELGLGGEVLCYIW